MNECVWQYLPMSSACANHCAQRLVLVLPLTLLTVQAGHRLLNKLSLQPMLLGKLEEAGGDKRQESSMEVKYTQEPRALRQRWESKCLRGWTREAQHQGMSQWGH